MASNMVDEYTSATWVAALRGDLGSLVQQQAYEQLGSKLYTYVYHSVRATGDQYEQRKSADEVTEIAQNAVQDTLFKLFSQRLYDQYIGKEGAQFTTFMCTIAVNRAIDLMRHEWHYEFISLPEEGSDINAEGDTLLPLIDIDSSNPVVSQELQALWEDVRRCVKALDQQRRLVFIWLADQEITVQEVATRLNKTENAIYQLYYHARKSIRECLMEKEWQVEDIGRLYTRPIS